MVGESDTVGEWLTVPGLRVNVADGESEVVGVVVNEGDCVRVEVREMLHDREDDRDGVIVTFSVGVGVTLGDSVAVELALTCSEGEAVAVGDRVGVLVLVILVLRLGVTLSVGVRVCRDPESEVDSVTDDVMISDPEMVTLSDCVNVALRVIVAEPDMDNCVVKDNVTDLDTVMEAD